MGNLSYSVAVMGRDDVYGVTVSLSGKYIFDNGVDGDLKRLQFMTSTSFRKTR